MQRPKLDKPRLEEWHNDDEQLANLMDFIDKKVLNISTWEFRIAHLNKHVPYDEVLKNIQERYPAFEWIEALKDSYIFLPNKFRMIKEDLFSVMRRFTLNLQERLNYIEAIEKYADELEQEVEKLHSQVDALKQQTTIKGIHSEIESLKIMISKIAIASGQALPVVETQAQIQQTEEIEDEEDEPEETAQVTRLRDNQ